MSALATAVAGNALVALLSIAFGWAMLWRVRHVLGGAYHLLALPAGLLVWPALASASHLAGSAFAAGPAMLGALVPVALAWATTGAIGGRDAAGTDAAPGVAASASRARSPRGFAVAGLVATAAAGAAAAARLTAAGYDSVFHYALGAVWLADTGRLTPAIVGGSSTLLPAMHAAAMALGASWTYAVYPLLALTVLGLLAYALWRWAFATLPPRRRAALTAIATALLAGVPAFVFHAFYVHTQMVSAAYLLASLIALRSAEDARPDGDRRALLAVAGLLAAGLVLARPDGLAYAFVLAVVAAAPSVAHGRQRDAAAFLAPLVLLVGFAYVPAFATLGLWAGDKLTGTHAAAMFGAWMVATAGWLLAARAVARRPRPLDVRAVRSAAYAALALGLAVVGIASPGWFVAAVRNGAINLFVTGGYGTLWYALLGMVGLTLAMPAARRRGDWSATLLLACTTFFGVALAVHGATHPGRLAPADSFNRVAFHAVPVVIWYVGSFLGGALSLAEDGALGKDDA